VEERAVSQRDVHRLGQQVDRNPHEGEKHPRKGQKEKERHSPRKAQSRGRPAPGEREPGSAPPGASQDAYQLRGAEHRRHHRGKAQGSQQEKRGVAEKLPPLVPPVRRAEVDRLEEPPGRHGKKKQRQVTPRVPGRGGCPPPQVHEGVHAQAVAQPLGKKEHVGAGPVQGPVQYPASREKEKTDPPVDGKAIHESQKKSFTSFNTPCFHGTRCDTPDTFLSLSLFARYHS